MSPEERLRRLRDDDRWADDPFVLREQQPRVAAWRRPLQWASAGVGIAAALVGVVALGAQLHLSSAASSAGSVAKPGQAENAAPATAPSFGTSASGDGAVVPWRALPTQAPQADASKGVVVAASSLRASFVLPTDIHAGSTLRYTVTLSNPTDRAIRFTVCPTLHQSLTASSATSGVTVALNCASARTIGARTSRTFAMQLAVPRAATGAATVRWSLAGGAGATADTTVLP